MKKEYIKENIALEWKRTYTSFFLVIFFNITFNGVAVSKENNNQGVIDLISEINALNEPWTWGDTVGFEVEVIETAGPNPQHVNHLVMSNDSILGDSDDYFIAVIPTNAGMTYQWTLPSTPPAGYPAGGSVWFGLIADVFDDVNESDEINNMDTDRVTMSSPPGDLYPSINALNEPWTWGDQVGFEIEVIESGSIPGSYENRLVMSNDSTIGDADDILIDIVSGTGQSYGWTLPSAPPAGYPASGNVWFGLIADSGDDIDETDENNNTDDDRVTMSSPPGDLYPSINAVNEPWTWGDQVGFEIEVIEDGFIPSSYENRLVMSNDSTIGDADDILIDMVSGAGQSYGWTLPSAPPAGYPASGNVWFGLIADSGDDIDETDENNNTDDDRVTMSSPLGDLEPSINTPNEPWQWGDLVGFEIEVVETGQINGVYNNHLVMSNDSTFGNSDDILIAEVGSGAMTRQWQLPEIPPVGFPELGNVYFGLMADVSNDVAESNESNNIDYQTVALFAASVDLRPEFNALDEPWHWGDTVGFRIEVLESGNITNSYQNEVVMSADDVIGNNDDYSLFTTANGNQTIQWELPSSPPNQFPDDGSVWFALIVDTNNDVQEINESNNGDSDKVLITNNVTPIHRLVSLGDSYSSGEGAGSYNPITNTENNLCHRSADVWSGVEPGNDDEAQITIEGVHLERELLACSGAKIADLVDDCRMDADGCVWTDPDNVSQVDRNEFQNIPATFGNDIVTFTIGGNDLGFSGVIVDCMIQDDCRNFISSPADTSTLEEDVNANMIAMIPDMLSMYQKIRNSVTRDVILVQGGYPNLFQDNRTFCDPLIYWQDIYTDRFVFHEDEIAFMNETGDKLNRLNQCLTSISGVHFVDVSGAPPGGFKGHQMCDLFSYFVPVDLLTIKNEKFRRQFFHPNDRGQVAYAQAFNKYFSSHTIEKLQPKQFEDVPACDEFKPYLTATSRKQNTVLSYSSLSAEIESSNNACNLDGISNDVRFRVDGYSPSTTVSFYIRTLSSNELIFSTQADSSGRVNIVHTVSYSQIDSEEYVAITAVGTGSDGSKLRSQGYLRLNISGSQEDIDNDDVANGCDNCRELYNPTQLDSDNDGFGEVCDTCPFDSFNDIDGDGLCMADDICPLDPLNDFDGDGLCAPTDPCPEIYNPDPNDYYRDHIFIDGFGDDVVPSSLVFCPSVQKAQ